MHQVAVGDHWTYQITDEIAGKITGTRSIIVTELSKKEITARFEVAKTGRSGIIIYDLAWDELSNGTFRYSPNDGTGVRLPLTVGTQWKFATDSVNSDSGATFKRVGNARISGMEKVTTKAGSFDAFVVETTFTSRNTRNPARNSEVSLKTWFSPEINHWVKRNSIVRERGHLIRNNTIELTEFGRKGAAP
jgi:hypothetical protein